MTDDDHLERINALTSNAHQTWFALLAALVFVGITLMGSSISISTAWTATRCFPL